MSLKRLWTTNSGIRVLQHVAFWGLSFYVFLHIFKIGAQVEKIDFVYTALFHASILPVVYINLMLLLPKIKQTNRWWYIPVIALIVLFFSWINYGFFQNWSNTILPDYFFISYFSFWQVVLFFVVYLSITSLLKLSKSWFTVNELQRELLVAEKQKSAHEKELLELEARALRAQMNPHFIFNCMNSIKALIQNDDKQRATDYLTTFSKLIRTIFQNADKRQISLYDEIETCKLYMQLEAMRLNEKLKYQFDIDPNLDLKSVMVPALIVQPFIENAIWHGIVPKDEGMIIVTVKGNDEAIICEVDDDGIGREMSQLNKPVTSVIHESKGVYLSKARLDLEKLLNEKQATIETTDKYENDKSIGTTVVITFNLN